MSSDRGRQFTSQIWSELAKMLGIQLHFTTAYHRQANGIVERFHRHLKAALRARLTGPDWTDELPWVLLGIRTQPKDDLRASSAELVYGTPLALPGEFVEAGCNRTSDNFLNVLRNKVSRTAPTPTSRHGHSPSYISRDMPTCEYVFIRRDCHRTPLQRPYDGPFKVLQRNNKAFTIDVGGKAELVSIDRLKAAHLQRAS